ncbi:hypothetical protein AVEN_87997-1 [Araneus ventricosus]|uniref:Uncharacterized protein n=1 Tax=Araneus ventricosus TaxID=182803 RepID=A0A4Y2FXP4_ARAVE|nr:hypothetical protein AVEN_87997-1 [Araneus ventricosus]
MPRPAENATCSKINVIITSISSKANGKRHYELEKKWRPALKSEIMTPFKAFLEENESDKKKRQELFKKSGNGSERAIMKQRGEEKKKQDVKKGLAFCYSHKQLLSNSAQPKVSVEGATVIICQGCENSYHENWIQCGL